MCSGLSGTALDICNMGVTIQGDMISWAYALVAVILVAAAVLWVKRILL